MEPIPGFKQSDKTILIVDDDPARLETVSGFMRGHYNTLVANNGAEAIARAHEFKGRIDLLLTALSMPEMAGIELASKISLPRPEVKVLLMSPFPDGMLVLNEGWHFIYQPFIESQLRSLIATLIAPTSRFSRVATPA